MNRFAHAIVHHKKIILIIFACLVAASLVTQNFITVNYNIVDYLPDSAPSTKAISLMETEFDNAIPNASVMVQNVSLTEAMQYKEALQEIPGVTEVLWLDDVIDIKEPLEMQSQSEIENYYQDGNALFTVTLDSNQAEAACTDILALIGEDNALAGSSPALVTLQNMAGSESTKAMLILIPIIIVILILATTSWLEPILFLAAIGISVIINMGINGFLPQISFVTKTVTPILQLACSLDYAIFLLHSFTENRKTETNIEAAMEKAVVDSLPTVGASAATTLFGFLALVFMDFGIGSDLGLNLAKGIVLSFISVIVFLPALTLSLYRWIDKTQHRVLLPDFKNAYQVILKIAVPAIVIVALVAVPAFLGQRHTEFLYGSDSQGASTRVGHDAEVIKDAFGKSTIIALLVPSGDVAKEAEMCDDLESVDHVTSITGYATAVGANIPSGILSEDITKNFYSENYARYIIYTDTPSEGDVAFATVEDIENVAQSYYGDAVYMTGQSANAYDMRNVVTRDTQVVNFIAIFAIFCVLLVTFRSITLPPILLLTIEVGIWVNLAIPYFSGIEISFVGYLIISAVQLGATVDYAILMTNNYMNSRKRLPKKAAIREGITASFKPILISGSILSMAGFALYLTSSSPIIYELGLLVGRGALLSVLMVLGFLPGMLYLLDGAIRRTTMKPDFFSENISS